MSGGKLILPPGVRERDLRFSDITTADVSITKHGLAPKAPNDTSKFLSGDGTYRTVTGGGGGGGAANAHILDQFPASLHAKEDNFPGTSLDGKWTNPAVTANAMVLTVSGGWVRLEPDTTGTGSLSRRFHGCYQSVSAGDFKIWGPIAANKSTTGTDSYDGMMVGVTGGKGHIWGIGANASAQFAAMGATTYNEGGTDWSTFDGFNSVSSGVSGGYYLVNWFRIRWDATGTTLYFDWSANGNHWFTVYSRAAMTQPDRIGFGMYAQGNVTYADKAMSIGGFHFEANATF